MLVKLVIFFKINNSCYFLISKINRETLKAHFPSTFEDGPKYDLLVKDLKGLQGTIAYAILLLLLASVCAG